MWAPWPRSWFPYRHWAGWGIPLAAGMALQFKMRKERNVVACFFSRRRAPSAEGSFHEAVNMARSGDCGDIVLLEQSLRRPPPTSISSTKNPRIADRAQSYGIRGRDPWMATDCAPVLSPCAARRLIAVRGVRPPPVLLELLTLPAAPPCATRSLPLPAEIVAGVLAERDPIERFARGCWN